MIDTQAGAVPYVVAQWFPADVRVLAASEEESELRLRRCRVYLTTTELVVFTAPDEVAVQVPVDFAATCEPPPVYPRQSWDVHTPDGHTVLVTPAGGCGCGHPLKRWTPDWASNRATFSPWSP